MQIEPSRVIESGFLQTLPCIETHISRIFLADQEVYKVKKPVDLGFLNFTTLASRRFYCEQEVTLNRRLAPDVYLGICAVTASGAGGAVVDFAVHMRRLDDDTRADILLSRQQLGSADVDRIATRIATFHRGAQCDDDTQQYGCVEVISRNVQENFQQCESLIENYLNAAQTQELQRWQLEFLAANKSVFVSRATTRRIRDCHGDLRLEHIYLRPDGLEIIDCIEFNPRFRFSDVCADVAFLAMDLTRLGAITLAERLLSVYAQISNDYDFYPLIDFYESYRATVRAKIAAFMAADRRLKAGARFSAEQEARRHFLLALAATRKPVVKPAVFAVGGMIASGKSTLAGGLALLLGAPVVSADTTRKWLLGVEATTALHDRAFSGAYDDSQTDRTYAEVLRRARLVVQSGRSVVLDASFRSARLRASARRLAQDLSVPFHFIECAAPGEALRARLHERQRNVSVSDGRLEILDRFASAYEAPDEIAAGELIRLDTTGGADHTLVELRRRLDLQSPGMSRHYQAPGTQPTLSEIPYSKTGV